ncbi:tetratricopeptide repeat-containing glycosyltransferase family protein [Pseudomonas knackmussii]|uniref:tetratricopeptide repeat-containing glycosyltransferase family protein n=1 Tax=Pseudomonas knackmussii TaxID=65741 RepID=UPI001362D933|nr:tetratricopeptide repeat-containing glycosyltransferase family protein [Pseudomonas knackmussii]
MQTPTLQAQVQRIAQALGEAERTGDEEAKIPLYRQLLKLLPDLALAHAHLAALLLERDREDEALPHVEHALALPQDDQVDSMLFDELAKRPRFNGHLVKAQQWYDAKPNLWRFKLLLAALNRIEAHADAEQLILKTLEQPLPPFEQTQVLNLLAQLYYNTGRFHESIACCQLGLEQAPDSVPLNFNYAVAQEQVARYREAFEAYAKVLRLDPDHVATHNNLALLMLRLGEFEQGWQQYEWRWAEVQKEHNQFFSIPRWQGESLKGKTLLVWAEQGIGDHIMFASMLEELTKLGGTIHYEIYERLDALFSRSFPSVQFVRRELQGTAKDGAQVMHRQTWPRSDYQIPMGSLPALLRPNLESFPRQPHYLQADPAMAAELRQDYQQRFPGKRLIGVSWRGGTSVSNEKQSRIIPIPSLAILAAQPDVQLVNLQYGDTSTERERARENGFEIHHDESVNPLHDMDRQAAQIAALDAVVSIDNTTVHLAGALGVPTYALLPLNPNWRWGLEEGPSYWYPSVRRVRNHKLNEWDDVLTRVAGQLRGDGILQEGSIA